MNLFESLRFRALKASHPSLCECVFFRRQVYISFKPQIHYTNPSVVLPVQPEFQYKEDAENAKESFYPLTGFI